MFSVFPVSHSEHVGPDPVQRPAVTALRHATGAALVFVT